MIHRFLCDSAATEHDRLRESINPPDWVANPYPLTFLKSVVRKLRLSQSSIDHPSLSSTIPYYLLTFLYFSSLYRHLICILSVFRFSFSSPRHPSNHLSTTFVRLTTNLHRPELYVMHHFQERKWTQNNYTHVQRNTYFHDRYVSCFWSNYFLASKVCVLVLLCN